MSNSDNHTGPAGPSDPLDLAAHAPSLGNPDNYFVNQHHPVPLVVEHATGQPKHIIDTHGQLRPYEDYRQGRISADDLPDHEPQPHRYRFGKRDQGQAKPVPGGSLDMKSGPSSITGKLVVENPVEKPADKPAAKKGPDKS